MSITYAELIRDVANAHQDLVTATADSAGNTSASQSTFSSTVDLLEEDDYYRGAEAYFTNGLNAGLTRRVYGSDYETQTITVIPALPFAPAIGNTVELYNIRGHGRRRKEYGQLINRAIREASGNYMIPVRLEPLTLLDGTGYVVLPAGIDSVCQFLYLDSTLDKFIEIRRAVKPGREGWWMLPGPDRTIQLSDYWRYGTEGMAYAVSGFSDPSPLVNDADTTGIDPEWIVETVVGMAQMSNPDNAGNMAPGQYARNRADAVRAKMVTTQQANCVRIPE